MSLNNFEEFIKHPCPESNHTHKDIHGINVIKVGSNSVKIANKVNGDS